MFVSWLRLFTNEITSISSADLKVRVTTSVSTDRAAPTSCPTSISSNKPAHRAPTHLLSFPFPVSLLLLSVNMCGIFGVCGYEGDIAAFRPKAVAMSKKLRSRGPDWSGVWTTKDAILCHERLAIVGVGKYQQSLSSCVPGEIWAGRAPERRVRSRKPPRQLSPWQTSERKAELSA